MYTHSELDEIFTVLQGNHQYSEEEIGKVRSSIEKARPAEHLEPFLGLIALNENLFTKLAQDKRFQTFSIFGLFPESMPLVYGSETSPELKMETGNRGYAAILKHPQKSIVIKPYQSPREEHIARIASMLSIGPKQLPSHEGFITEEYVDAPLFTRLREPSKDLLYATGRRFGDILRTLHENDIYYNDNSLADDFARSHLFVPSGRPALLFDYGVALDVSNVREWGDQEIFDYVRTLPGTNMAVQMGLAKPQQLVDEHAADVRRLSKGEIFARDEHFAYEGMHFASMRIGNLEAFARGFEETYQK